MTDIEPGCAAEVEVSVNSSGTSRAQTLADLPGISFLLAAELTKIGIRTPEALRRTTAAEAWRRLRASGYTHDSHVLFALEGAIQGVPWRELSPDQRHSLLAAAGDCYSCGEHGELHK